jgi:two-component system response regulator FlrC
MALSIHPRHLAELTPWARLAQGAAGPSAHHRKAEAVPTHATILIVEDNAGVREALVEILRPEGYGVLTAATVQEAEEARRQLTPGGIDVVIANVHLTADREARGGYALWQRWTALNPQLRFILISGDPSARELPAIRAGVMRWLTKPFSPAEVLDTVRDSLGR